MRITVVSCNGSNNISRIKRLKKVFRVGCVTVTRLATVQAIAKFRKIYLFGFHKIQTSCCSYRRIHSDRLHPGDPVSPTGSRFRELAISITRAHGYRLWSLRLIVYKRRADL